MECLSNWHQRLEFSEAKKPINHDFKVFFNYPVTKWHAQSRRKNCELLVLVCASALTRNPCWSLLLLLPHSFYPSYGVPLAVLRVHWGRENRPGSWAGFWRVSWQWKPHLAWGWGGCGTHNSSGVQGNAGAEALWLVSCLGYRGHSMLQLWWAPWCFRTWVSVVSWEWRTLNPSNYQSGRWRASRWGSRLLVWPVQLLPISLCLPSTLENGLLIWKRNKRPQSGFGWHFKGWELSKQDTYEEGDNPLLLWHHEMGVQGPDGSGTPGNTKQTQRTTKSWPFP